MRRRIPLQKLRGSDPTLLEVQTQDLLTRPSGQLEPANLADLFALAEHENPPKSMRRALDAFVKRCCVEIGEIADSQLDDFVKDFVAVEAARLPQSFRDLVVDLSQRDSRDPRKLTPLIEHFESGEPTPFELGQNTVKVQRASAANAPRSGTSRTRRSRSGGGSGGTRSSSSKPSPRKIDTSRPAMDIDKRNWLIEILMERLGEARESGLAEAVLVAGIRHRARSEYPRLMPFEITSVLSDLEKAGRVRKSAGRWSRSRR